MKIQFKKEGIGDHWLFDIAKSISENVLTNVEYKDGKICFPEKVGSGYVSYHRLDDDIELCIYNHTYKIPVCIERLPTDDTEFYCMHINCSPTEVSYFSEGREKKIGGSENSSVFWSASDIPSSIKLEPGETFLGLMVYMTKKYLQNVLGDMFLAPQTVEENDATVSTLQQYDLRQNNADKRLTTHMLNISHAMQSKIGRLKYELVQEIINFDKNSSIPEKLFLKANVLKILALFIKRIADKNERQEEFDSHSDTNKIFEIKKFIDANAGSELISLDELARNAAMSKTKLKTKFKEIIGKTAYQYYLDVKMEKAKAMLEDCNIPITNLAYELGFKSTSHFSQAFKKHYGVTPKSVSMKNYPQGNVITGQAV